MYLRQTDGSPPVHLGEGFALSLSPDGQWVLVRLYTKPPRLVLLPTGAGQPRPLPLEGLLVQAGAWFPDGKRLLLLASAGGVTSYYALDAAGGRPRAIAEAKAIQANRDILRAQISPDGRLLARVGEGGRLSLLSLDGGGDRPGSGVAPDEGLVRWSADGRSLYVVRRAGTSIVFTRVDPFSGRREPWKVVSLSSDPVGLRGGSGPIQMSADGKAIFWGYQRFLDELYLVEGLK